MKASICTLCEGSAHQGVAVLANSLFASGFRGGMFVATRGDLPPWAVDLTQPDSTAEGGAGDRFHAELGLRYRVIGSCHPASGLTITFVNVETPYHFANVRVYFMRFLSECLCESDEALFYFDNDIVVTERWSFFLEWADCGLALCEDVNSPLAENHPRRVGWRKYYDAKGIRLRYRSACYYNGGFIGVSSQQREFLSILERVQEAMAPEVGGLEKSIFQNSQISSDKLHYSYCFSRVDQDALNAALEAYDGTVSVTGQEGMGFKPGHSAMLHAVGPNKPWSFPLWKSILQGRRVPDVYFAFWRNATYPIRVVGKLSATCRLLMGRLSQLTCRLYGP